MIRLAPDPGLRSRAMGSTGSARRCWPRPLESTPLGPVVPGHPDLHSGDQRQAGEAPPNGAGADRGPGGSRPRPAAPPQHPAGRGQQLRSRAAWPRLGRHSRAAGRSPGCRPHLGGGSYQIENAFRWETMQGRLRTIDDKLSPHLAGPGRISSHLANQGCAGVQRRLYVPQARPSGAPAAPKRGALGAADAARLLADLADQAGHGGPHYESGRAPRSGPTLIPGRAWLSSIW
jgi:hypothetical protein